MGSRSTVDSGATVIVQSKGARHGRRPLRVARLKPLDFEHFTPVLKPRSPKETGRVGRFLGSGGAVGRVELDYDITFCLDWFVVQQCGLITPFVNSFDDRGNQVRRAIDRPYVFDAAVRGDGGVDTHGIAWSHLNLSSLRIDAGNQFADHHFLVSIEGPPGMRRGHAHGTLDVDGNRG